MLSLRPSIYTSLSLYSKLARRSRYSTSNKTVSLLLSDALFWCKLGSRSIHSLVWVFVQSLYRETLLQCNKKGALSTLKLQCIDQRGRGKAFHSLTCSSDNTAALAKGCCNIQPLYFRRIGDIYPNLATLYPRKQEVPRILPLMTYQTDPFHSFSEIHII
jgi:hypothetical protein